MIKVLIVDDQLIFRESLKFTLEQDNEIEVVDCAGDGKEAFASCEKYHPDVVLMDIVMPECDGIEGLQQIKSKYEDIKVIMLTTFSDSHRITRAIRFGADGYVLKDINLDDLVLAIKSTARGLKVLHQDSFDMVKKQLDCSGQLEPEDYIAKFKLTDRDIFLIQQIASGNSNKEIAQKLFLSEGSVRNSITALLKKLSLIYRVELAVFAVKSGLA